MNNKIDETLRSLDGLERANPGPFFYTRVQARLDRHREGRTAKSWTFRPAWVAASLGLVLALNVSAVLMYQRQLTTHEQQQATETVADEWGIDPLSLDW
ncbi:hypothetical protein BN8_00681 [Fibrisoma limi BUZ 3]|uniref:Uncharacterized protein n=2 Tax=Fibrisoma limi TaxID=663275 RepID=I2GCW4_9BACT|nr:hypothetical protein BN8_00681 [Fibrisoma limi BUZ 3]